VPESMGRQQYDQHERVPDMVQQQRRGAHVRSHREDVPDLKVTKIHQLVEYTPAHFVRIFVHNIRHMMTPIPDHILWCYGEYQTLYGTVDGVDFQQGLPDLDNLDSREKHLIILDDLMDETDQRVASLFTKKSHHRNISVMYIVQNLFHRGKHHRTISLNAHYMVVFKNPRDVSQIMALAHQMYPQRTKYFLEAYTAATAQPHGYLVIDMKQETPDILRLRSHIFPGEKQIAYADI